MFIFGKFCVCTKWMIPSVVVVPERGAQISRILLITFHDQKYEESSVCVCELSD